VTCRLKSFLLPAGDLGLEIGLSRAAWVAARKAPLSILFIIGFCCLGVGRSPPAALVFWARKASVAPLRAASEFPFPFSLFEELEPGTEAEAEDAPRPCVAAPPAAEGCMSRNAGR